MNIERGLLWNQENAVNRGVQVNYTAGPVALAASWNDGFYSDQVSWLWGSATWTVNSANTLALIGGGNTRTTDVSTMVTPLFQNNEEIYDLIYTHTDGPWTLEAYLQGTYVPRAPQIGAFHNAETYGGALYANYTFDPHSTLAGFSIPVRAEYIASTGSVADGAPNLMYGPGSEAWSLTVTPTYQHNIFFARPEFSFVEAAKTTPGMAFGSTGNEKTQARLLLETGVLF
jgi:Putative beta-barrel porin-2, OmpL-like. bbp2